MLFDFVLVLLLSGCDELFPLNFSAILFDFRIFHSLVGEGPLLSLLIADIEFLELSTNLSTENEEADLILANSKSIGKIKDEDVGQVIFSFVEVCLS